MLYPTMTSPTRAPKHDCIFILRSSNQLHPKGAIALIIRAIIRAIPKNYLTSGQSAFDHKKAALPPSAQCFYTLSSRRNSSCLPLLLLFPCAPYKPNELKEICAKSSQIGQGSQCCLRAVAPPVCHFHLLFLMLFTSQASLKNTAQNEAFL